MELVNIVMITNYAICFLLGWIMIWWFFGKFLWSYLKVRASRGKYTLVRIWTNINDVYYRVGQIEEGMLHVKDRSKAVKTIPIQDNQVYRSLQVYMVDYDEEQNIIL
jgi:hypothetical protein